MKTPEDYVRRELAEAAKRLANARRVMMASAGATSKVGGPAGSLCCAALVRRLRALEKHWTREAADFHRMGKQTNREGYGGGNEYMQIAAAFRSCASQLKQAR